MPTARPVLRWSLVGLAAAGVAVSWTLWMMMVPNSWAATLCPARATVSCEEVLASDWAKVSGVPMSGLGVLYFGFLGLWYAAIGLANVRGRAWHAVPMLVTLGGCALSLRLVFAMAYELPAWCPWCVAAHVINGALLVLGLVAWPRRPRQAVAAESPPAACPTAARVFGVMVPAGSIVVALLSMLFAYQQNTRLAQAVSMYQEIVNDPEYAIWRLSMQRTHALGDDGVRPDDLSIGPATARHTVIVFSDFECPHCEKFHALAPQLVAQFPAQVRVVFKHYPLCDACNRSMDAGRMGCRHKFACDAAKAAEAVRVLAGPDAALRFADLLFENRTRLTSLTLEKLAGQVGVSADKLTAQMSKPETKQRILEDTMLAGKWSVEGSGDVYLDGRRLQHWRLVDRRDHTVTNLAGTLRMWGRMLGAGASSMPAGPPNR